MRDSKEVEMIKEKYPVGTRIRLEYMQDNYGLPSGMCGTVEYVDDEGQIGMNWDNGRTLSLVYGVDKFEIISEPRKALFKTKFDSEYSHNGEIVDVIGFRKGKDVYCDRYTVKFNDGTINEQILSTELNFDFNKTKNKNTSERSR